MNDTTSAATRLAGTWRAVLDSPGGDLPFTLKIDARKLPDGDEGGTTGRGDPGVTLDAVAITGPEEVPFSAVVVDGSNVTFEIDWYDARIEAVLDADESALTGRWSRTSTGGESALDFEAKRGDARRFVPLADSGIEPAGVQAPASVAGSWRIVFTEEDGAEEPAVAELVQAGSRVTGTILTPTGDYRYLEGTWENGVLRLSCFDGSHAFLFHARAEGGGDEPILRGDFWSRDTYHATWTARRAGDEPLAAHLPDPMGGTRLTNPEGRLSFTFPGLDGETVSFPSSRFDGKVVLVDLLGSWCPNCNDAAPVLARWQRTYRDRGLEVIGLAYEMTGEPERDLRFVRRFSERHGLGFPMLLAGTADKSEASKTMPDLSRVAAYPTTIFIGRDGRVRKIHTGWAGPATGAHHERLVSELERTIEELLAEPAT